MSDNNKLSTRNSSSLSTPNILSVDVLKSLTNLANSIASPNSPFAENFLMKTKDGKPILDDNGLHKVDTNAIVGAMVLGNELGISPMASLMLGRKLNANSYYSILRGRELGIDSITSINKIYVIPNSNGDTIALSVDIITAKMIEAGVVITYLRDNLPVPTYKDINGRYIGHKYQIYNDDNTLKDGFFVYVKDKTSKDELQGAMQDGKIIVYQSGITNVSTVKLDRQSTNTSVTITYSLQEAIDASLYNGFHSYLVGDDAKPLMVKGKANWNNHPATHLRHRPLSIGGRIIAADVLKGNYSIEEAMAMYKVDSVDELQDISDNVVDAVEIPN